MEENGQAQAQDSAAEAAPLTRGLDLSEDEDRPAKVLRTEKPVPAANRPQILRSVVKGARVRQCWYPCILYAASSDHKWADTHRGDHNCMFQAEQVPTTPQLTECNTSQKVNDRFLSVSFVYLARSC